MVLGRSVRKPHREKDRFLLCLSQESMSAWALGFKWAYFFREIASVMQYRKGEGLSLCPCLVFVSMWMQKGRFKDRKAELLDVEGKGKRALKIDY